MSKVALGVCLTFLICIASACRTAVPVPEETSSETKPAARHALQSQQLKTIMSGLQTLNFERLPQELDSSSPLTRQLEEASQLAGQMAETAKRIPSVLETVQVTTEDRELFLALVQRLGNQASQLKGHTRARDLKQVNVMRQEISATCVACHILFRDFSGPGDTL
jgi:cytochrome c556